MRNELKDPAVVYRRRWLTLTVLCISLMVIGLDNTILNVALPTLAHSKDLGGLGASGSALQWIVDSYTLVFAGLLLTMGSLGDRFGRYKFLTIGLVVFGTGSVLSAFAPSAGVLIATRSLMGVGGACIMPGTLSILSNVFRSPGERARAIGVWAGVSALGVGIGPVAGGALLTHFWWGSVFLVNLPIVVTALVLGYFLVPDSYDKTTPRLDPVGALLSIVSLGVILWSIIEAPSHGWTSPEILTGFAIGIVLVAGFLLWELKSSSPMLDLHFFQNPRFSAASAAIMLVFLALFGTIFLLTQYLQSVLGYSTIKAGAVLIPQSAALMFFAFLSPRWVVKFGNKVVVAFGLSLVALSLIGFVTFDVNTSMLHVIIVTVLMGIGMGNVMSPATESIMGSLPREKAGVGSAMNDTTRQVGGAIGVAVLGSIAASRYGPRLANAVAGKLPAPLIQVARDSVGRAIGVVSDPAHPVAAGVRSQVVAAAHQSFIGGLHLAAIVAAGIVAIAVVGVVIWLPARAPDYQEEALESAPEREAVGVAAPPELAVVFDHD
ncbi:MAG TPA: MFS transporter [Acidimicrobiia bacterium]|nr:MFS transporter [Acidimicrobiia bacterium]